MARAGPALTRRAGAATSSGFCADPVCRAEPVLCCGVPRCAAVCRGVPRCAALSRCVPRSAALSRCAALCRAEPPCATLCRGVPRSVVIYLSLYLVSLAQGVTRGRAGGREGGCRGGVERGRERPSPSLRGGGPLRLPEVGVTCRLSRRGLTSGARPTGTLRAWQGQLGAATGGFFLAYKTSGTSGEMLTLPQQRLQP